MSSSSSNPPPTMDGDLWHEIRPWLDRALDLEPDERVPWIEQNCPERLRVAVLPLVRELGEDADAEWGSPKGGPPESIRLDADVQRVAPDLIAGLGVGVSLQSFEGAELGPYRVIELLAEGGMSEVYRAERTDGQFDLEVAVKVLHRTLRGHEAEERFKRERQILASLRHENICRILDGGLGPDHRPYVVLELVRGRTLLEHCTAEELGWRERLDLFHAVLDAVSYAHEQGVIHRDLKPSNILVERRGSEQAEAASGRDRVVVLDFGIARGPGASDLTRTGMSLGTPGYLAPELTPRQGVPVEALEASVSEASDVFSLGVMLFELLADRRADLVPDEKTGSFPGAVPQLDATAGSDLPVQALDLVIGQCLRADAAARYPSVRALAEDLRRAASGRPVEARPVSRLERLRHSFRRHPLWWSVAAVASLLAILLLVQNDRHRRELDRMRATSAVADRIDGRLRAVRMLPTHDVRDTMSEVREEYLELRAQTRARDGLGHALLGRIALSLEDYEQARDHFLEAQSLGYGGPEVSLGLGRALTEVFRAELRTAQAITSRRMREERIAQVRADLLEPALAALRRGEASGAFGPFQHPDLTRAWLAWAEDDPDRAVALAESVGEAFPEIYEAYLLAGRIERSEAVEALNRGAMEEAVELQASANGSLARAVEVGRSDAAAWLESCRLWPMEIRLASRQEGDPNLAYSEGSSACAIGLTVDPSEEEFEVQRAYGAQVWGQARRLRGEPMDPAVRAQIEAARRALEIDPNNGRAHESLGIAFMLRSSIEHETNETPTLDEQGRGTFEQATFHLERSLELRPDSVTTMQNLALAWFNHGQSMGLRGGDPLPAYEEAIRWLDRALEQAPEMVTAWSNHAMVQHRRAERQRNQNIDPRPALESAIESGRRAVELDPEFGNGLINLSDAQFFYGEFLFDCGWGDEAWSALEDAMTSLRRAVALFPDSANYRVIGAKHFMIRARVDDMRGIDPAPGLLQGLEFLEPGLGKHVFVPLYQGALRAVGAELMPERRTEWLDAAQERARYFAEESPDHPAFGWLEDQIARAQGEREERHPCFLESQTE